MSPSCLAGLAIVVVEDHDDARRYMGLFLGQLGAKIMVARNAFDSERPFHTDLCLRKPVVILTSSQTLSYFHVVNFDAAMQLPRSSPQRISDTPYLLESFPFSLFCRSLPYRYPGPRKAKAGTIKMAARQTS
jgi:hypothetical protein